MDGQGAAPVAARFPDDSPNPYHAREAKGAAIENRVNWRGFGCSAHARPCNSPLRPGASAPPRLRAQGCAPALNAAESTVRQ